MMPLSQNDRKMLLESIKEKKNANFTKTVRFVPAQKQKELISAGSAKAFHVMKQVLMKIFIKDPLPSIRK